VPWPDDWGTPAARTRLVHSLADELEKILATRTRSTGREATERIKLANSARAVEAVYRRVIAGIDRSGQRQ
jgi:hypothetical protein